MSLPAHNSSYDDSSDFVPKATPVAPPSERMDAKPARKAEGAFRTISEVADELDVPQHVLRFWETKFSQVKPLKRGGGRRYYRPEDVSLLKHIHYLLYTEGYTIKGVQKLLKGQGKNQIAAKGEQTQSYVQEKLADPYREHANAAGSDGYEDDTSAAPAEAAIYSLSNSQRNALEEMLGELKAMRALIPQALA